QVVARVLILGLRLRSLAQVVLLSFVLGRLATGRGRLLWLGRCFVRCCGLVVGGCCFGSLSGGGCRHRCGGPPRSPRLTGLRTIGLLRLSCCRCCFVPFFRHGRSSGLLP